MKKFILTALLPFIGGSVITAAEKQEYYSITVNNNTSYEWVLEWIDDFDSGKIDEAVWTKIPTLESNNPDWRKNMSTYDGCFEFRDGNIVLKGIINPGEDITGDRRTYLTGGIYTLDKKFFPDGKIEVRAKYGSAQGAWPAIWMMGENRAVVGWPDCGEIDLMEHLNYEDIFYQTLHTPYTQAGNRTDPVSAVIVPINKDIYNVYGAELGKDTVKVLLNDSITMSYPRTGAAGQFPFDQGYFLLIDMQIGGSWVGAATGAGLPVEMEVDWVKFYKKQKKGGDISVYNGSTPLKPGDKVRKGEKITVMVNPAEGCAIDQLIINGKDVSGNLKNNKYTFKAGQNDSISASYKFIENR